MSVTRILVVDDEPLILRAMTRSLRSLDGEVVCVETLDEGLKALASARFDLIITDIGLGEDSGLDVARAAARMHPTPTVIAMSGQCGPAEGLELGKAGVAAFIQKPFAPATLMDVIDGLQPPLDMELDVIVARTVGVRPMPDTLDAVRRSMVKESLAQTGGNKAQAAGLLGISRQHLQKILERGQG